MPNESGFTPLADLCVQLAVGTPPVLIFTPDGRKVDRELVQLSLQARQAAATERLAEALEAQTRLLTAKSLPGFSDENWADGLNHLHALHHKGERTASIEILATSPEMAMTLIGNIGEVLKAAAVAAEQQEGQQGE